MQLHCKSISEKNNGKARSKDERSLCVVHYIYIIVIPYANGISFVQLLMHEMFVITLDVDATKTI